MRKANEFHLSAKNKAMQNNAHSLAVAPGLSCSGFTTEMPAM